MLTLAFTLIALSTLSGIIALFRPHAASTFPLSPRPPSSPAAGAIGRKAA